MSFPVCTFRLNDDKTKLYDYKHLTSCRLCVDIRYQQTSDNNINHRKLSNGKSIKIHYFVHAVVIAICQ